MKVFEKKDGKVVAVHDIDIELQNEDLKRYRDLAHQMKAKANRISAIMDMVKPHCHLSNIAELVNYCNELYISNLQLNNQFLILESKLIDYELLTTF